MHSCASVGWFRIRAWPDHHEHLVYDLGMPHVPLWYRRFIPAAAVMPPPCSGIHRPLFHESRHVRQERSNHAQRRRLLRRRFVQELAA